MLTATHSKTTAHGQLIDNENVYLADTVLAGTAMCFDFGEQRIGVAIGEHIVAQAQAITSISNESNSVRFNKIAELVAEWQPSLLVVGLPLNLDGEETPVTQLCKKFARRLNGRFNLPVILIDERYSSVAASELLKQAGVKGRAQKIHLDQMAAQTILQSYFDSI
ncbi:MAG: Holliday junction resolvase RuvX [Methylotenera sp.]|nr:Holliday junction resolvase RuvX [Methylotenera sp.]